jgi:ribose 5-phosphate isomerase RpiB
VLEVLEGTALRLGHLDYLDFTSRRPGTDSSDLTAHQIDVATRVLRRPMASRAILADEVGLGKTIEADRQGAVPC